MPPDAVDSILQMSLAGKRGASGPTWAEPALNSRESAPNPCLAAIWNGVVQRRAANKRISVKRLIYFSP